MKREMTRNKEGKLWLVESTFSFHDLWGQLRTQCRGGLLTGTALASQTAFCPSFTHMHVSTSVPVSSHCSHEHCFVNKSSPSNWSWLRFSSLSTPAHASHTVRKPSTPEVFQRTLQDPEKTMSNHCLPLQPHFSVTPQEVHWLRPGQGLERSAAPFSRSKLKKTPRVQGKPVCSKTSVDGRGEQRRTEPLWQMLFLVFLPAFLNGASAIKPSSEKHWLHLMIEYSTDYHLKLWIKGNFVAFMRAKKQNANKWHLKNWPLKGLLENLKAALISI